jgi:hypothetical protein
MRHSLSAPSCYSMTNSLCALKTPINNKGIKAQAFNCRSRSLQSKFERRLCGTVARLSPITYSFQLINWPRKGLMEHLMTKLLASPLLWAKKSSGVIWDKHLNRWKTCQGCHQSNTSICKTLTSRTKELQAEKRQKLAVGLLTGHTTLTAHLFNLGLTQR